MTTESVREVPLERWGKALLEEILFRAAERVTAGPRDASSVEVALTFRLTPNVADDCLEIRADGAAEPPIVTRLTRPF